MNFAWKFLVFLFVKIISNTWFFFKKYPWKKISNTLKVYEKCAWKISYCPWNFLENCAWKIVSLREKSQKKEKNGFTNYFYFHVENKNTDHITVLESPTSPQLKHSLNVPMHKQGWFATTNLFGFYLYGIGILAVHIAPPSCCVLRIQNEYVDLTHHANVEEGFIQDSFTDGLIHLWLKQKRFLFIATRRVALFRLPLLYAIDQKYLFVCLSVRRHVSN